MNIMLLMMGGSGSRFGADRPKQYIEIDGKPVFSYILEKCNEVEFVDRIVIVSNSQWIDYVNEWVERLNISKGTSVISGGKNRSESVKNGLLELKDQVSEDDVILIHDATHPYLKENDLKNVIDAVNEFGAATLGQLQYDTVYYTNSENVLEKVIPRERVVSGASPEAFRYGDISKIYFNASSEELSRMTSAGAIALANGIQMKVVPMTGINIKITYPQEMELFKILKDSYLF